MTVYKNTNLEADAASKLAIALIKGDKAAADALATGTVKDTETGKDVPSALATPVAIYAGQRQAGHLATASRRPPTSAPATFAAALHEVRRQLAEHGGRPGQRAGPPSRPVTARGRCRPAIPSARVTERPATRDRGGVDDDEHSPSRTVHRTAPLLSLRGINKSFGAVHVLRGVDLDVRPGQVTALVGDNGAGKSTLIKGIAGIHAFDAGEYTFEGKPVTRARPQGRATPSASRSSTRTSRCATTSTSSTTCSSAAS